MTDEVNKLGRRVAELEDTLAQLLRTGIGLGHSSFDNGQLQQFTDGTLGSSFGTQFDGTNGVVALNGPIPPTPRWSANWGVTAEGVIGGLRVRWEGFFEGSDEIPAPLDFASVEVYARDQAIPSLMFDYLRTSIRSARGGEVLIPLPVLETGYYLWLVTRTTTGRTSGFSQVIGPFFPQKVREEDLGFDLADLGGSTISRGPEEPASPAYGDLWLKLPDNISYQFSPPDPGSWVEVRDQGITDAIETAMAAQGAANAAGLTASDAKTLANSAQTLANAAQTKANQASTDAAAAAGLAQTAKSTADGKITVYRQVSPPSGGAYALNDLWLDTDDSNKLYAWTGGAWLLVDDQRIATALTTAQGKTTVFAQISAPSTTGRTAGDIWIDTDDGNKQYVWDGAWTARTFGVSAIAATARQLGAITIFRQTSQPTTAINGDYWIDTDDGNKPWQYNGTTWIVVQDQAVITAINNAATAQAAADGKARVFVQPSAPTGLVAGDIGDVWIDSDDNNKTYTWDLVSGTTYGWVARQISNSSIKPNSLIAKDVVATGTVTAALLEAVMVLATTIISGDPTGTHVKIKQDGVYVYTDDPVDGVPNEVIRMGTASNDFFGITDPTGVLQLTLDQTGAVNGRTANFREDITVQGRPLSVALASRPAAPLARFRAQLPVDLGPIQGRVGISEIGAMMQAGRLYRISWRCTWYMEDVGSELKMRLLFSEASAATPDNCPAPTINSAAQEDWERTNWAGSRWYADAGTSLYAPTTTARRRFLLTTEKLQGTGSIYVVAARSVEMIIEDLGPSPASVGNFTQGGGALANAAPPPTPVPVQGYFQELGWVGRKTYRGNGTVRTDTAEVVQGWDPSGFNGDGFGAYWFLLPDITGTVTRVDVYLYASHWYYNSGGTARVNIGDARGSSSNMAHFTTTFDIGGVPKPGGVWVTLPAEMYSYFRGVGNADLDRRASTIILGPGGGTNLTYYGRIADCRLRIWWTQ